VKSVVCFIWLNRYSRTNLECGDSSPFLALNRFSRLLKLIVSTISSGLARESGGQWSHSTYSPVPSLWREVCRHLSRPGNSQTLRFVPALEPLEPRRLLAGHPFPSNQGDWGTAPYIDLGPADNVAWDQPRVAVELFTDAAGTGSVGPGMFNTFLLDTGANSVIAMASATQEMMQPPHVYTTEGKFLEQGVAGTSEFDISSPYRFDFAGSSGIRNTLLDTRILSDPENDVSMFGPWGIAGMPLMVNRVTTLDMTGWITVSGLEDYYMQVAFANTVPAGNGHRYSVAVDNRITWDPEEQVIAGDYPPVWADVPFLTAIPAHDGTGQAGNFLLDTGAQMSVLSESLGMAIGLDSNSDGVLDSQDANYVGDQTVGGIGGQVTAPVFMFDEIHVPTQQDVDLVWTNLQMIVLDITPGLDGVFGCDFITAGWASAFYVAGQAGYSEKVHFDFRDMETDGTGTVYFDLNPNLDQVLYPGAPAVEVTQSGGSTLVSEQGFVDTYELTLTDQPTDDVTISLTNSDGQLTAVDDANPSNDYVVFSPSDWSTPRTVLVAAVDDVLEEGPHSGTITHTAQSADSRYDGVAIPNLTASIIDNDVPGVTITASGGSTEVSEEGTEDTYEVVLNYAPTADVTITLTNDDDQLVAVDDANPANDFIVFTPSDWSTPQSVRVAAVDDVLAEGPHNSLIEHSAQSADAGYDGISIPNLPVGIIDNDVAGVTVTSSGGSTQVIEGGDVDTYEVVLTGSPTDDVTIALVSADGQLTAVDDANPANDFLVFTASNWSTPQVVRVEAVDDAVFEGPHEGLISHSASSTDSRYQGLAIPSVRADIYDNDSNGPGVLVIPSDGSTDVVEGGGFDLYYLVLTSQPSDFVAIQTTPTDNEVTAKNHAYPDYGHVIFMPEDWNIPQAIRVTAVDDDDVEGPHSDVITHTIICMTPDYEYVTVDDMTVNIVDDDTSTITVVDSSGLADDASIQFTTALSQYRTFSDDSPLVRPGFPDAEQYIDVTNDGNVALTLQEIQINAPGVTIDLPLTSDPGDDIVLSSGQTQRFELTYAPTRPSTFPVDPTNDNFCLTDGLVILSDAANMSSFEVALRGVSTFNADINYDGTVNLAELGTLNANWGKTPADPEWDPTADINGDDVVDLGDLSPLTSEFGLSLPLVLLVESDGSTEVAEGGATDTYTLQLSRQPTGNVEVAIASDDQTQVDVTLATFTPTDWNVPQTITVEAIDNTLEDGPRTSFVTHTVSSSDPDYHGLPVTFASSSGMPLLSDSADLAIGVLDDDTPVGAPLAGTNTLLFQEPDGRIASPHRAGAVDLARLGEVLKQPTGGARPMLTAVESPGTDDLAWARAIFSARQSGGNRDSEETEATDLLLGTGLLWFDS